MPIEIREATSEDAELIAKIHVLSWQAAYADIIPGPFLENLSVAARTQGWRKSLEAGRLRVLLAYVEQAAVGWIAFGASRDADKDGTWAEVEALYILPAAWGQGVGKCLSDAARHILEAAGYANVMLWVLSENQRARAFYQHIGFVCDESSKAIEIGGAPLIETRYGCALRG